MIRVALHHVKKAVRACARPSVVGAGYMLALTVLASRAPIVEAGDHALGAQAREVSTFVVTRFGGEIRDLVIAIGAAAIVIGLVLGAVAGVLVQLRQVIARRALVSGPALGLRALGVLVVLHAWLVLDAMARAPQLYADTWYARGGVRRAVQVVATDALGTRGTLVLGVVLLAAYLAGPPSSWRTWPRRIAGLFARGDVRTAAAVVGPIIGLAALWPSARVARAASTGARPNVIILAADSFRADRLTTSVAPHLSALA